MKKIIFISYLPPTLTHEKNYYYQELLQTGADIEVWDISRIVFGPVQLQDSIERTYIRGINNKDAFSHYLSKVHIPGAIFILCLNYTFKSLWLFRMLTRHQCTICTFARGCLPKPTISRYRKILGIIKARDCKRIYRFITHAIAQFYRRTKLVKDYDFVFAAGSKAESAYRRNSKVVSINSFDYDTYMQVRTNTVRLVKERYCVFVDDALPVHPDFSILGTPTIEPAAYYERLNDFFAVIEREWQMRVVIAAHPKANYTHNPFRQRIAVRYKTCELVRDAEVVIAHASTAIGFGVLFQKPIMLIYDNDIQRIHTSNVYVLIRSFADALGSKLCNIDDCHQMKQICLPSIDAAKYEAYKYQYLTSRISEDKLSKDIFLDYINSWGNVG